MPCSYFIYQLHASLVLPIKAQKDELRRQVEREKHARKKGYGDVNVFDDDVFKQVLDICINCRCYRATLIFFLHCWLHVIATARSQSVRTNYCCALHGRRRYHMYHPALSYHVYDLSWNQVRIANWATNLYCWSIICYFCLCKIQCREATNVEHSSHQTPGWIHSSTG